MAKRGSYAKGIAKREEILERALEVIARSGMRGASVKEIADAAGLTPPGLLHYFDSKEELFTAILRKRDEVDGLAFVLPDLDTTDATAVWEQATQAYLAVIRHNASVPGLVELFSRLAVDAADAEHPAHDYFLERSEQLHSRFARIAAAAQRAGIITDAIPADSFARILHATSDGLQLQWLTDPSIDMAGAVRDLFAAFAPVDDPDAARSGRAAAGDAGSGPAD